MTDTDRTPDQIRSDIERTRRELGGDVDALADKVTPSKIIQRQTDKVKSAFCIDGTESSNGCCGSPEPQHPL
ncbi:DUF3618 domain-containing protein [Cryobacterium sp. TMT1-2-2]|nr:DUF3618 domain-containing protein [Cryobacterium sp. TMT1-66-1]TFD09994.1 DUF3618 domain-containing protein [Cryobacterium sp. TMT1-2-2]